MLCKLMQKVCVYGVDYTVSTLLVLLSDRSAFYDDIIHSIADWSFILTEVMQSDCKDISQLSDWIVEFPPLCTPYDLLNHHARTRDCFCNW